MTIPTHAQQYADKLYSIAREYCLDENDFSPNHNPTVSQIHDFFVFLVNEALDRGEWTDDTFEKVINSILTAQVRFLVVELPRELGKLPFNESELTLIAIQHTYTVFAAIVSVRRLGQPVSWHDTYLYSYTGLFHFASRTQKVEGIGQKEGLTP